MESQYTSNKLNQGNEAKQIHSILSSGKFKRRCFLFAGFLSVFIGILGILLPILDTTPFMLMGAYCFAQSSPKWHKWLLKHPVFGDYIAAFREKRGLTIEQKRRIALTITLTLLISVFHNLSPEMTGVISGIWIICMTVLYFSRTAEKETGEFKKVPEAIKDPI